MCQFDRMFFNKKKESVYAYNGNKHTAAMATPEPQTTETITFT